MAFNSVLFIFFFAVVACSMLITNLNFKASKEKIISARNIMLLIFSYIFCGWADVRCALLLLALTIVTYFATYYLGKTGKKVFLYIGVIVPLALLGVFKYFNFFVDSFVALMGIKNPGTITLMLPLGISFYTFQALSYTIDVERGKTQVEKSFVKVALYIAFFPKLVSGPVAKARDFMYQLDEDRKITWKSCGEGIWIFVFGLFKKIVIADNIAVCVNTVFAAPNNFHALSIICAVVGYSIQIYCDFSGYSDMAIGCARFLGYDLKRNFNMPYISKNITNFWKRWHISLSEWLQEYLYISLGGNRKGAVRTYINLFLTMLIGGLWHGAAWTFVVWGALHGVALCVHKVWMKLTGHDKKHEGTIPGNILSGFITFVFVSICWVFFRADSFTMAWDVLYGIATWQDGIIYISDWVIFGLAGVVISTLIAYIKSIRNKTAFDGFYPVASLDTVPGIAALVVAIGICLGLAYTGGSPFIYAQF